jgi:hypothetical protein
MMQDKMPDGKKSGPQVIVIPDFDVVLGPEPTDEKTLKEISTAMSVGAMSSGISSGSLRTDGYGQQSIWYQWDHEGKELARTRRTFIWIVIVGAAIGMLISLLYIYI